MTTTRELYSGRANLVTAPQGRIERLLARLIRPGGRWDGTVARGGRVTVSTQEVVFRPNVLNPCRDILRIPVRDVVGYCQEQHHAMRLLVLWLADGSEVALVSWQRDRLGAAIGHAHELAASQPLRRPNS